MVGLVKISVIKADVVLQGVFVLEGFPTVLTVHRFLRNMDAVNMFLQISLHKRIFVIYQLSFSRTRLYPINYDDDKHDNDDDNDGKGPFWYPVPVACYVVTYTNMSRVTPHVKSHHMLGHMSQHKSGPVIGDVASQFTSHVMLHIFMSYHMPHKLPCYTTVTPLSHHMLH